MRLRRVSVLLSLTLLIGGCATNQLRIERAGAVVQEGQPLIRAANALIDNIVVTSRDASVEFALADPQCDWPEIRIATGTPAASLCDPASSSHTVFTRIDRAAFTPTLRLIGALSGYVAAVDAVASGSTTDERFNLAAAKAEIEGIAGAIGPNPISNLSADQQKALDGIVAMIDTLTREAAQAQQLQAIEANNPKLHEVTAALRRDLGNWADLALVSELSNLQSIQTLRWQRDRMLRINPDASRAARRELLSDDARRALLRQRLDTEARLAAAKQLPATLSQAVSDFETAHDSYVNALENKALTPENRARLAELSRERLRQALALLAQTVAAFA